MLPISVVIPCYNCADRLDRAIASVLAQTQLPAEMIVVNDGSSDTISAYQFHGAQQTNAPPTLVYINHSTNLGPAAARNTGWDAATQPYIAFLDADDVWHPRKLEIQFAWMQAHGDVAVCGHDCVFAYGEQMESRAKSQEPRTKEQEVKGEEIGVKMVKRRDILRSNPFVTPSMLLKCDLPCRFDPSVRYCEDYLLLMQLCLQGHKLARLDVPLVTVTWRDKDTPSLSKNLWRMRLAEMGNYWRLRQMGLLNAAEAFGLTLFSAFKFIVRLLVGHRGVWWLRRQAI
ncbi:MAG: glycosyltransferase family 2 protein [Anaerolineae bacterium]|nr:glycosyltransferase family 2 protein [Anaerolineae bacterium]